MAQIFAGQVRFGIHAGPQHVTFQEYLELWQQAEAWGLDWASVFDHFIPIQTDPEGPCFEGLTLLSALAAHTKTIRCGILVVGNTYRHPALLANIATTIDHVSGGRLELGLGAGWWEMEHEQYGVPLHRPGRRIRMLGEAAQIVRSLWREPRTTFEGRYYQLEGALSEPKPLQDPAIPLWIGGGGEQLTLRVAAESADGWNAFFMPLEQYRHKLDVLARHCADLGRDPGDIRKSIMVSAVVRNTEAEVEEHFARLTSRGLEENQLRAQTLAGTPEQVVDRLVPYLEAGAGDFLLMTRQPYDYTSIELWGTAVAPLMRKRLAGA